MLLESLTLEFGDKTQTFKRLQLQCAAWVPVKWMRGFKTRVPWPEKVKTTPVHYTLYPNTKHSNTRPVLSLSLSLSLILSSAARPHWWLILSRWLSLYWSSLWPTISPSPASFRASLGHSPSLSHCQVIDSITKFFAFFFFFLLFL